MATLARTPYPLPDFDWSRGIENDPQAAAYDELVEVSRNLPDGEYVGGLIQFPYADGYAIYRVVSIEPRVVLQHVPFGDAWQADPSTIRGLRAADVRARVDRQRAGRSLFGSRRLTP